jgi:hypothetical protein
MASLRRHLYIAVGFGEMHSACRKPLVHPCHRTYLFRDQVSRLSDVVLTFLAGGSLPLALGFEPPRGSGYGFYVVAGCDGQNRLAARCPATARPLIERCDLIAV